MDLGHVVKRHNVRTSTLKEVLDGARVSHVDILKVDVEGFEERVLLGNDWGRYRPSVIMVEVTYPQTSIRRSTNIRPNLEAMGYRHFYFDNLNDFFVDGDFVLPEDATLPPNIFDNFVRSELVAFQKEKESLQENFTLAEAYARSLEAERTSLVAQSDTLASDYTALQQHIGVLRDTTNQAWDAVATMRRLTVAALLGRNVELQALMSSPSKDVPKQEEWTMADQSKTLIALTNRNAGDQDESCSKPGSLLAEIQAELLAARLQASEERSGQLLNDIDDLRHENSRLLASVNQLHGENQSLRRALAPSYMMHDEVSLLREQIDSRDAALVAQIDSRMRAVLKEETKALLADRSKQLEERLSTAANANDTLMLRAVYVSNSWRLTAPFRLLKRLLRSAYTKAH